MARFKYSEQHLAFLRVGYKAMKVEDLTKAFNKHFSLNKTECSIRSALKNHKITCGRKQKDRLVNRIRLFTAEQKEFIKDGYKKHSIFDLTVVFNDHFGTSITEDQIRACTRNHGITSGRTGFFPKGNQPWNAGTKGQGLTGANKKSFKKGHTPANTKPLGSERISKDGFIEVKVAEKNPHTGASTRYKHKQRHVWELNFGPIPAGMTVAFKDSDKTNCEPENLMLISRAELLAMNHNGYRKMPTELKPSVLVLSKLQVKTRAKAKELEEA